MVKDFANNKKFQQITTVAADLFHKYGIKRVSVEEICETAAVSKATFYKFFSNKKELICYLFNEMADATKQRFIKIMEKDVPFEEKVNLTVKMKLEHTGDLSQTFIDDILKNADDDITQIVNQRTREGIELATRFYADAQKKGDIRPDINLNFIIYISQKLRQLMVDEKLTKLYPSPKEVSAEIMNFFFYGILPKNRNDRNDS